MNIINYIEKHKNEDFKTFKFTEVDNLILALIPYLNLTNIIPSHKKKITLNTMVEKLNLNKKNLDFFIGNTYKMVNIMKNTKRYGNILLYNYHNIKSPEMQFGALTMKLDDKSIYIAFAGTDTSIIGWKENFKMIYHYPNLSQKYAGTYLNKTIRFFNKNIYVGGHSKGGNLAITAAMQTKNLNKHKIKAIYNNDGPGLLKEQVESSAYKKIENKIKMFVPEESIIGMILYHTNNYTVVKAKSFNILEHNAFNWLCTNNEFLKAKQTKRSKQLENKLTKKLEKLPIPKRVKLIEDLFSLFETNNIKDVREVHLKEIFILIKSFHKIDKETQNLLLELILTIFIK